MKADICFWWTGTRAWPKRYAPGSYTSFCFNRLFIHDNVTKASIHYCCILFIYFRREGSHKKRRWLAGIRGL